MDNNERRNGGMSGMDTRKRGNGTGMSVNGNGGMNGGADAGVGISGNAAGGSGASSSVDVGGNAAVSHGEGLGGASGYGAGHEQGLGQKAHAEAKNGARTENGGGNSAKKSSDPKKIILAIALALVVLVLIGVGIWLLLSGQKNENDAEVADKGGETEIVTDEKEEGGNELVELSLDDEVVQKLYRNFDGIREGFNSFYLVAQGLEPTEIFGIAADGDGSDLDLAKIGVALTNLEYGACAAAAEDGILQKRYEAYGGLSVVGDTVSQTCYTGQGVRGKIREIFGEEIEFYPLKKEADGNGWERDYNAVVAGYMAYAYDPNFDEFYAVPFGAEGKSTTGGLYKAEKKGDRAYLYEVRDVLRCSPAPYLNEETQEWESASTCEVRTMELKDGATYNDGILYEWNTQDGDFTVEDMLARKEDFSRYKWTFKKNAEGNYVFESLESVK